MGQHSSILVHYVRNRRIILGLFLLTGVTSLVVVLLYATHSPPLYYDMKQVLAQRFDKMSFQSLDIKYAYGSMVGRDGPTGDVVGYIKDKSAQQGLLSKQPFTDCSRGCSSWVSRSSLAHTYTPFDLLANQVSVEVATEAIGTHSAATQPDAKCNIRFHYRTQSLHSPTPSSVDIFCLSAATGAFAYMAR